MLSAMMKFDFVVVGAGIAGASIAAHLAGTHSVLLLEMEQQAGYHSTGRSAASYEPNYGPPPVLALTRASLQFFQNPPDGFADAPLLTQRDSLFLEARGQDLHTPEFLGNAANLAEISGVDAQALFPVLRQDYATRYFRDTNTADIDVDLLHRGFLRMFKARGGRLIVSAPLHAVERIGTNWKIITNQFTVQTPTIINAAGAWGDVVARLCNVQPIGLQPKRRSIGVVPVSTELAFAHWPMVMDIGETWYCKPQSGKLIVSSADATPVEPHDAYADDMAIAEGIDRLMAATTLEIDRLENSWGGLRSFAPDGQPVVGFDPHTDGFFWLVGQGGYGIQSCPALAETAAALARQSPIPQHVLDLGLRKNAISPQRFSS